MERKVDQSPKSEEMIKKKIGKFPKYDFFKFATLIKERLFFWKWWPSFLPGA